MIIVTGGAGLIGSNFIWQLNQHGMDDILVVDNLASTEKWKNLSHLRYSNYMHRDKFLEQLRSGQKLEGVEAVIEKVCKSRKQVATTPSPISGTTGMYMPYPVEVTVGGATIFVLDVEQFRKI